MKIREPILIGEILRRLSIVRDDDDARPQSDRLDGRTNIFDDDNDKRGINKNNKNPF